MGKAIRTLVHGWYWSLDKQEKRGDTNKHQEGMVGTNNQNEPTALLKIF